MERRILFIGETSESFLVVAMEKTLSDAGFEVVFSHPSAHEIATVDNLPDIMIVYIEGDENKFNMMYPFLQKLLTEEGKNRYLYLIGNQVEIQAAYKIIPHMLVSGAFKRPVNSADLISQLNIICSDHAYDETESGLNNIDEKPNKKSILLVDDDSVLLRSMQTWLSISYNVFIASSGTNTISFLRQRKVDLILLDYAMPGLSGLEVFQILKSDPETADIPVIFLTAKDDKDTVMKVLSVKPGTTARSWRKKLLPGRLMTMLPLLPRNPLQTPVFLEIRPPAETPGKWAVHTAVSKPGPFAKERFSWKKCSRRSLPSAWRTCLSAEKLPRTAACATCSAAMS